MMVSLDLEQTKDFVLAHNEVPIYSKTFNPVGTMSTATRTISIPSHFSIQMKS